MGSQADGAVRISSRFFVVTGLALTLVVLLLGIEHFGRFDLLGFSLEANDRDFVTATGRVVHPASIDEGQYMMYVAIMRGTPRSKISEPDIWAPFSERVGVPWLAHFLPIRDEGVSLAVTNVVLYLVGLWATLAAIRRSGTSPPAFLLVGVLLALNWNTFWFSTSVLVDPIVFAFMGVGCWLLVSRRPWWTLPMLAVAYPLKETCVLLVLVLAAWSWRHLRGRPVEMVAIVGGGAALTMAGYLVGHRLLVPQHVFDNSLRFNVLMWNIFSILTIGAVVLAFGPIVVMAVLRVRMLSDDGWWSTLSDPWVVGFGLGIAVVIYSALGADLSPRLFFPGLPFAALLSAQWLDSGGQKFLERIVALPVIRRVPELVA